MVCLFHLSYFIASEDVQRRVYGLWYYRWYLDLILIFMLLFLVVQICIGLYYYYIWVLFNSASNSVGFKGFGSNLSEAFQLGYLWIKEYAKLLLPKSNGFAMKTIVEK